MGILSCQKVKSNKLNNRLFWRGTYWRMVDCRFCFSFFLSNYWYLSSFSGCTLFNTSGGNFQKDQAEKICSCQEESVSEWSSKGQLTKVKRFNFTHPGEDLSSRNRKSWNLRRSISNQQSSTTLYKSAYYSKSNLQSNYLLKALPKSL